MTGQDELIRPSRRQESTSTALTLQRGLDILDLFSSEGTRLGVNEIARRLSLHKSTVSRLCATLKDAGYLIRDEQMGSLRLGPRVYQLAGVTSPTTDIRRIVRPVLQRLAEACSETALLAVLDGLESVTIEVVDGFHTVRTQARVGGRRPVHACSSGKAILAALPPEGLGALIEGCAFTPLTPNTITNKRVLMDHLEQVRRLGYSVDREELEEGLSCIAAPVYDHTGRAVAAVSVSGPRDRMAEDAILILGPLVRASADEISSLLGAPRVLRQPLPSP